MAESNYQFNPKLDLIFERIIDVPRELIWKGWTVSEHLKKWFCPLPWKAVECEIDLHPGGIFRTVMSGPEGEKFPGLGCYLEVVENERLVWTNALFPGFRPAQNAIFCSDFFFTATITLTPHDKGTKYSAIVLHQNEEGRKKHEEMGFEQGWGKALAQLVSLIKNDFKFI